MLKRESRGAEPLILDGIAVVKKDDAAQAGGVCPNTWIHVGWRVCSGG